MNLTKTGLKNPGPGLVVYASNKVASLWASDTKNTPTCFGLHLLLDVKSRVVFYPGQVCL